MGDFDDWRGVQSSKSKNVTQRFGFLFRDEHVDFHFVLEMQRLLEIALRVDARPADGRINIARDDGKTDRAEKTVLRDFHVVKKIREVDDARHVRLSELDA